MTLMDQSLRKSKYWRYRAEETRVQGSQMAEGLSKATMLDVAHKYDLMARQAAEREARVPKNFQ